MKTLIKSVAIMGIGGCGVNTLGRLNFASVKEMEFLAVNTDARSLLRSKVLNQIQLGNGGRGTGGNPSVGSLAAEQSGELREALKDVGVVVLIAGMSGGTGGASWVIARMAKTSGAQVFAVGILPFCHELRGEQAKDALVKLRRHTDHVKVIQNESINVANTDLESAFGIIDRAVQAEIENIVERFQVKD